MTAAGMSMHMAMINARASKSALGQKSSEDTPDKGDICLTADEIQELRKESGKFDTGSIEDASTDFIEEDDNNPLPKCCIML